MVDVKTLIRKKEFIFCASLFLLIAFIKYNADKAMKAQIDAAKAAETSVETGTEIGTTGGKAGVRAAASAGALKPSSARTIAPTPSKNVEKKQFKRRTSKRSNGDDELITEIDSIQIDRDAGSEMATLGGYAALPQPKARDNRQRIR